MDFLTQILEVNPVRPSWQRELSFFPEIEEDSLMRVEDVEVNFEIMEWMNLSPKLPSPLTADIINSPISLLSPISEHTPPPLVMDCQESSATSQPAEGISMDFTGIGNSLLCIASPSPEHISPMSATNRRGASAGSQSARETSPTSTSIVRSPDIVALDYQGVLPSYESAKEASLDDISIADSSTSVASSVSEHSPFILATGFQGDSYSQPTKWLSFKLRTQKAKQDMSSTPQRLHITASDEGDVRSSERMPGDLQTCSAGQLRNLRYQLQKAILRKNKWLEQKDTELATSVLKQLEEMQIPPRAAIVESRIDVLLRRIQKVWDIPGNEGDQVTQRAVALFKKWKIGSKERPSVSPQEQLGISGPLKSDSDLVPNLDCNKRLHGASTQNSLEENPNTTIIKKRKRLPCTENRRLRQKHDVNYRNDLPWLKKTRERCGRLLEENTADMKSLEEQMRMLEERNVELLKEKADLLKWGAEDAKVTAALERGFN